MNSLLARLRQPRTWASLVVLLLVGGLYLVSEFGGSTDPGSSSSSSSTSSSTSVAPSPTGSGTSSARPAARPSDRPSDRTSDRPSTDSGRDPLSGLLWVDVADLPRGAEDVLQAIEDGGPFVREKDGSTFGNYERVLPSRQRGYYREYTVPTPGVGHAGARRIVTGAGGEYYWTPDHYQSFDRIRR